MSGDFAATVFFEVSDNGGNAWQPAKAYDNSHDNTGENLITDVGEGFLYTPANAPVASLDATSFDYGARPVGTTSPPHTFTLSNLGTANLDIASLTPSGDFTISATTCSGSIAPSGPCTIDVVFSPSTGGPLDGSVVITDTAAGSPRTISLHGFGQQPAIEVNPVVHRVPQHRGREHDLGADGPGVAPNAKGHR